MTYAEAKRLARRLLGPNAEVRSQALVAGGDGLLGAPRFFQAGVYEGGKFRAIATGDSWEDLLVHLKQQTKEGQ